MACVPHGFDHFDVATRVASAQVGIPLYSITDSLIHGKAITSDNVTNIIKTITETKMYSEQAKKLRKLFQFAGGAKRAADLVEFYAEVGYDHLVPAYAKYEWSWVVYYNLDVYFLLSLLSFLLIYSTYAITKHCYRRCCKCCRSNGSSNKTKKD
jgi:glucuronosyltransferase